MHLLLLEDPGMLLETAFRKGRKEAGKISLKKQKDSMMKQREILAVGVAGGFLSERLWNTVKGFPSIDELPPFYAELFPAIIDAEKTKKALSHFNKSSQIIERIKRETILRMRKTRRENPLELKQAKKAFFGRAKSIVKRLGKSISVYNDSARRLGELPKVDFGAKTIILSGYPNTGKTTILKRITGSTAKIASYPFTTTRLNVAFFSIGHSRIQVIDTPGLLDKQPEKRNPVEKKAIAALRHLAGVIVFVADASMHCGYPLALQKKLFVEMENEFRGKKILLVFNKGDITGISELEKAGQEFGKKAIVEGEGKESSLKEEIGKALS